MLQLSHDLSDKHPPEDSAIHAILIHSLLKAAAVLKVVGVVSLLSLSLSPVVVLVPVIG